MKGNEQNTIPGIEIKTLSAFIDETTKNMGRNFGKIYYRGENCEKNILIPRLHKLALDKNKKNNVSFLEKNLLMSFYQEAPELEKQTNNLYEKLTIAQHYGLPTRLLDWTASPLVALWFALNKDFKKLNVACVWGIRTSREVISDLSHPLENQITFENIEHQAGSQKGKFFLMHPKKVIDRSIFQNSIFTVHSTDQRLDESIDKFCEKNCQDNIDLTKYYIKPIHKITILKELYSVGVNAYTVLGNYDSLARKVKYLHVDI